MPIVLNTLLAPNAWRINSNLASTNSFYWAANACMMSVQHPIIVVTKLYMSFTYIGPVAATDVAQK
jgi:hypothetical protein